jgi:cell division protein FtsW
MGREKNGKNGIGTTGAISVDPKMRESGNKALKTFLLSIIFLIAIGWMMLLDSGVIYKGVYNPGYFQSLVYTRLTAMLLGLLLAATIWRIPPKTLRKYSWLMIILAVIFLVLIFTPLGVFERGSRRWLNLGVTFQPLEFVKLALVWFLADQFARIGQLSKSRPIQFLVPGFLLALCVILVGMQPNLSGVFFLIIITLTMTVLGGINLKPVMALVGLGAIIFLGFLALNSDRMARFVAYDPLSNLSDKGYQLSQSLWAVSNGGLLGRGPGGSIAMYSLPDHTTDFVYSIVAEEWGFIGGIAVIILFGLVIYSGFRIALVQNDPFRLLLGCGISSVIGIQAAVNIGVVLGLLPTTGVPLPFISAGGSNLILSLGAAGLFLNFARTSGEYTVKTKESAKPEATRKNETQRYKAWHGLNQDIDKPKLSKRTKTKTRPGQKKSRSRKYSAYGNKHKRVRRTGT